MSKSYTLNRDAIFFFFDAGRVKVNTKDCDMIQLKQCKHKKTIWNEKS